MKKLPKCNNLSKALAVSIDPTNNAILGSPVYEETLMLQVIFEIIHVYERNQTAKKDSILPESDSWSWGTTVPQCSAAVCNVEELSQKSNSGKNLVVCISFFICLAIRFINIGWMDGNG